MMEIAGSTVMVTGASGGLGAALCEQFLSRGAASVYAAARDVTRVRVRGTVPVTVDITDPRSVGELAARCDDVGVLVNNAGTAHTDGLFSGTRAEAAMLDMSVNYFGTMAMTRAFAPVLARNGGGALVNVLSVTAAGTVTFRCLAACRG
jgi:NAD(P)-dependent dehydrogenase (short-subunit alcohol dehydrogenase family)